MWLPFSPTPHTLEGFILLAVDSIGVHSQSEKQYHRVSNQRFYVARVSWFQFADKLRWKAFIKVRCLCLGSLVLGARLYFFMSKSVCWFWALFRKKNTNRVTASKKTKVLLGAGKDARYTWENLKLPWLKEQGYSFTSHIYSCNTFKDALPPQLCLSESFSSFKAPLRHCLLHGDSFHPIKLSPCYVQGFSWLLLIP